MKHSLFAALLTLLFLGLAGCADEHIISTNDGHMIESDEKPEVSDDAQMLEYEDEDGDESQVPMDDVEEVKER